VITGVIGTGVVVITVDGIGADAKSIEAVVDARAGVAVIALGRVGGVETDSVVADVLGADVRVRAVFGLSNALGGQAAVVDGAGVTVVALAWLENVDAAVGGITEVLRAGVLIITVELTGAHARARRAGVGQGAHVLVVTWARVGDGDAPLIGLTEIVCARISILAVRWTARNAQTRGAGVTHGTEIAVFAGRGVVRVFTAQVLGAGVVGAGVIVIAVHQGDAFALTRHAGVVVRTGVVVVTVTGLGRVLAPDTGDAPALRTRVLIVAHEGDPS